MPIDPTLIKESLGAASKKSMGIAGLISGGFGFFADVLEPIAPFASYVCIISLIALVALICISVFGILKKDVLPAIVFAGLTFAITGMLTLMKNSEEEEEKGVLATMMPAISGLQSSLGILQKDVTEIKETTARTEGKVDQVLEGIENVSKLGGIIANPDRPEEFYHNAKIYELGGDYSGARRSYLEYFKKDTGKLDPHLRFIKFLKVQEGRAGAREVYREVTSGMTGKIPEYVSILLLLREQRVEKLRAFSEANPEFGPVWYHLSKDYTADRVGTPTIADRRDELKFAKAFKAANDKGQVTKYFIDQELVSEWGDDAEKRRIAVEESILGETIENPVSVAWMSHNGGSTGTVTVKERTKEILWKIKGADGVPKKTQSTGMVENEHISMGMIQFPKRQKPVTIEITYTDHRGGSHGPFEFKFNPSSDALKEAKKYLEMTKFSWVELQTNPANSKQLLLYFTQILVYRIAIEEVKYSLDTETPDKVFELPKGNDGTFSQIDPTKMKVYLKVPEKTQFASVQLTYKDGTKSEVIRFDRK